MFFDYPTKLESCSAAAAQKVTMTNIRNKNSYKRSAGNKMTIQTENENQICADYEREQADSQKTCVVFIVWKYLKIQRHCITTSWKGGSLRGMVEKAGEAS